MVKNKLPLRSGSTALIKLNPTIKRCMKFKVFLKIPKTCHQVLSFLKMPPKQRLFTFGDLEKEMQSSLVTIWMLLGPISFSLLATFD